MRRPRLDDLLAEAAERTICIVQASAGYGKSSELASFAVRGGWPTMWFSVGEGVADPLVFLLHLVYACRTVMPEVGTHTIALLESHEPGPARWAAALDALINDLVDALDDETLLILDDLHVVADVPAIRALLEQLINHLPPRLHLVLATRHWPQLHNLLTLHARGELLAIREADLAFTPDEMRALFAANYSWQLTPSEAAVLHQQTGGWPIALQLIGQGTRHGGGMPQQLHSPAGTGLGAEVNAGTDNPVEHVLGAAARELVFAYLAQDVFADQPPELQSFLLRSAVLTQLEPQVCDWVLHSDSSSTTLQALDQRGVFLTMLSPDRYRYHPLFHAFLRQQGRATLPDWAALHLRAADYYRQQGSGELVLEHLSATGDLSVVAAELERWAEQWLDTGRFTTLLAWTDRLPDTVLAEHPQLLVARGDAARLLDRFELAVAAYQAAEHSYTRQGNRLGQASALAGQARVLLDTVRPARAHDLLRQAYRLIPRAQTSRRAALLRLIAENRLNGGRADQAARLYQLADQVEPPTPAELAQHQPRLLLRLGRLSEAAAMLRQELRHNQSDGSQRPAEAHREATVLLAYICALQGDHGGAAQYAQQALTAARQRGSGLLEAIAEMRMGHACQLGPTADPLAANQHYLQAIALADSFNVQRTKAEAYLGLALLHGFGGDLRAAQAAAHEGLASVEPSGDMWMAAQLWTALGAISVVHGAQDAPGWLGQAQHQFERCKDTYGQAMVRLWQAIWWQRGEQSANALPHIDAVLALVQQHDYAGLLTGATLLGPRDRMMLVPILLTARADQRWHVPAQRWLADGFPAIATDYDTESYHPGSTLRVQTLGTLRVWRGMAEIAPREWRRKKAALLLALLITNRHRWLLRDQICEWLWPDETPAEAVGQLKVTLHALNTALEPARPARTQPFYIRRQDETYRFVGLDGVWLDVEEFEARVAAAQAAADKGTNDDIQHALATLMLAVGMYGGEYLSEYLYEEWSQNERERLRPVYLEAVTLLAELLIRSQRITEAIQFGELIVARNPAWEDGYRLLIEAYTLQGNRQQALATYERCVRNLQIHLGVAPLPRTTLAYEAVKRA